MRKHYNVYLCRNPKILGLPFQFFLISFVSLVVMSILALLFLSLFPIVLMFIIFISILIYRKLQNIDTEEGKIDTTNFLHKLIINSYAEK